MLDVSLRNLGFTHPKSGFALRGITITFDKSTHTAIVGPPACGASTLLRLIQGTLQPDQGEITIGARPVNRVKASRRPLLFVTSTIDAPLRWSVQHALIAAVRKRTLDRQDRELEYDLAVTKWRLEKLTTRRLDTLSTAEQTLVHLASIELLRPGILLADRLLERLPEAADDFYRTMRVLGTTVISAPATHRELGTTNAVAVLENGKLIQTGSIAEVFAKPASEAAAAATGDASIIPIEIRGTAVESPIGAWDVAAAPFQGTGVAIIRPGAFSIVPRGEESDVLLSVEEASFEEGRWIISALISGGTRLCASLPGEIEMHKGKLVALRYDPAQFHLLPRERAAASENAFPSQRDTR